MKDKIRIALMSFTIDGRKAKGTAVVARKCIESLLDARNDFDLAYIHYEKSDDPIYNHGVREVVLPNLRPRFINRRSLRLIYYFLTTKDRFDIIQWFQPRLYPLFWKAPARHIVVWTHGAGDFKKENRFVLSRFVMNWTMRLFNKKISVAIAGSTYSKNDIVREYWMDEDRVRVINNGVDASFVPASAEEIRRVKEKYHLPETFFLDISRLIPNKNVERTFNAVDQFFHISDRKNIHFVNIGDKGTERQIIDAIIDKSPYKDRFHLVGYVEQDDLPAFYSAAFALVFPICNEGLALPALEAMACGTPTVISATAAPEITSDDAILVDALNVHDIAHGMQMLVEDDRLRMRLIERGLALAKVFTWERTGEKVLDIYRALMVR